MSERGQLTRWCVLLALGLATAVMFAVSIRGNYLFGYSLGQSPEKAQVFAWASVASDLWKSFGLIAVSLLWRARRRRAAALGTIAWVMCLLFGLNSAISLYVQDRSQLTGLKQARHATYQDAQKALSEVESKLNAQRHSRSAGEIEAEIDAIRNQVVKNRNRVRGTVASVSRDCMRFDSATNSACQRIAQLRQEQARAVSSAVLEAQVRDLREQMTALRDAGASSSPDPVGEFYEWITGGFISVREVGLGFPLFFAILIEVVSAFGPVTIAAYAEATRRVGQSETQYDVLPKQAEAGHGRLLPAPRQQRADNDESHVVLWVAERALPSNAPQAIGIEALYDDYAIWSAHRGQRAVDVGLFQREFDRVRDLPELLGKTRKFGGRYFGLALRVSEDQTTGVRRFG